MTNTLILLRHGQSEFNLHFTAVGPNCAMTLFSVGSNTTDSVRPRSRVWVASTWAKLRPWSVSSMEPARLRS